jgi:hypothetical protein
MRSRGKTKAAGQTTAAVPPASEAGALTAVRGVRHAGVDRRGLGRAAGFTGIRRWQPPHLSVYAVGIAVTVSEASLSFWRAAGGLGFFFFQGGDFAVVFHGKALQGRSRGDRKVTRTHSDTIMKCN